MAPTPIIFQFRRQGVDRGFLHRLAGESVWCERPLTADAAATGLPFRPALPLDRNWTPIYDGPGLLAGGVERIRSER
ncbi:MAG: hypothetical protein ABI639_16735, partial [Thermoanaerobaculia bacterium]